MNKIYTLIVYTPGEQGWNDRYGDCHDGKESNLEIRYFTDSEQDDLIQYYGYEKFNNPDAEFTLLINGHNANEPHDSLNKQEQDELFFQCSNIEDLADKIYRELIAKKEQKDKEIAQRKLQEQEEIRLREKKKQEDAEKAELERLMAKYGK